MVDTKLHCFISKDTINKVEGEACVISIEKNKDNTHTVRLGNIMLGVIDYAKGTLLPFGGHLALDVDDVLSKVINWTR